VTVAGVLQISGGQGMQLRISSPGVSQRLIGTEAVLVDLAKAVGHCVRIFGQLTDSGIVVESWRRLGADDTIGTGQTCAEFQGLVRSRSQPTPSPTAPAGGGVAPEIIPSSVPISAGAAGEIGLPAWVWIAGAAAMLWTLRR